jgi:hypothetical protein
MLFMIRAIFQICGIFFAGQRAIEAKVPLPRPPFFRDATQSSSSFQSPDEHEGISVQSL